MSAEKLNVAAAPTCACGNPNADWTGPRNSLRVFECGPCACARAARESNLNDGEKLVLRRKARGAKAEGGAA